MDYPARRLLCLLQIGIFFIAASPRLVGWRGVSKLEHAHEGERRHCPARGVR